MSRSGSAVESSGKQIDEVGATDETETSPLLSKMGAQGDRAYDAVHDAKEALKSKWDSAVIKTHEMLHSDDESSDDDEYEKCDCVDDTHATHNHSRKVIPYTCVYEEADTIEDRGYLMPGYPVKANIVSMERDASSAMHLFNPYLYTIEFEHGPYKWQVQRRYKDFSHLHTRMLMHRAAEKMKQPVRAVRTRVHDRKLRKAAKRARQQSNLPLIERSLFFDEPDPSKNNTADTTNCAFNESGDSTQLDSVHKGDPSTSALNTTTTSSNGASACVENADGTCSHSVHNHKKVHHRTHRLPDFPRWPESTIGSDNAEPRRKALDEYLQGLLHIASYRNHKETAEFMEVSRMSFVHNLGGKYHEAQVKKRPGGSRTFTGWKRFCIEHCARWSRRHLFIKDSFVAYLRRGEVRYVMLFDQDFKAVASAKDNEGITKGLYIINRQRELQLACYSDREAMQWKDEIDKTAVRGPGAIWTKQQPFGSTYPRRQNNWAQWFVDGEPFMKHAANMIELAQEDIFITDWWLSPEIYMKRPVTEGNRWSLMNLLRRKAEQGVKVFILLYKEVEMALGILSWYSKAVLVNQHPNITVLRHPDHAYIGTSTLLWAHHEKLICIDQNIAFVGGIDLAFGRWDNAKHRLTDNGSCIRDAETKMTGMRMLAKTVPILAINSQDNDSDEELDVKPASIARITEIESPGVDEVDASSKVGSTDTRKSDNVRFAPESRHNQSTESEIKHGGGATSTRKTSRFRSLASKVVNKGGRHKSTGKDGEDG